MEFNGCRT